MSRRLCVLGVARLATKKKRKKKSEKKKPRVHRTEARALVCVWTEEDTTEDDQHTKRFQFCTKLTTNESSLRDSRSRSVVSRDRRPRRNTTTTTIMGGDDELAKHTKVRRRDHLFFFVVLYRLVPMIGFLFSSSSLQNAKEEEKPKRFFFSTIIRDFYRFQKEEVNKKQELTTLFVANTTNSLTHRNDQPTNKKGQNHREQPNETKADRIKRDG